MNNEYIIVNKTAIQKRIEELENTEAADRKDGIEIYKEMYVLKQILSQSTPLIPEIEKAFDAGDNYRYYENNGSISIPSYVLDKEDYISKLDI